MSARIREIGAGQWLAIALALSPMFDSRSQAEAWLRSEGYSTWIVE